MQNHIFNSKLIVPLIFFIGSSFFSFGQKSLMESSLSDSTYSQKYVNRNIADSLYLFFKSTKPFVWDDHNNCEDRANAICLLLTKWGVPNYKGWVFSGKFLKRDLGQLCNSWKYHVAAIIPVLENQHLNYYVIDPATLDKTDNLENWASKNTSLEHSYYIVKKNNFYIYNGSNIAKDNWQLNNETTYKWTMQGLSGLNGANIVGTFKILFDQNRVKTTQKQFESIKKPAFIN